MSKPVTTEEVEDVLSSIRRLVSEDKRPLAGLRSKPADGASAPASPSDRLVLTPALRVAEAAENSKDATETDSPDNRPLDLGSVARETWSPSKPQTASHVDDAVATDNGSDPLMLFLDTDASENQGVERTNTSPTETYPDADELVDGNYGDEEYWEIQGDAAQNARADAPDDNFHDDDADWDVDASEVCSTEVEEDLVRAASDAVVAEVEQFFEQGVGAEAEPEDTDAIRLSSIPLTAKIAALEAAVGKIANDWEPDGDETDELAVPDTPAMAWEDDIELDARGEPVDDTFEEDELASREQDDAQTTAPPPGVTGADDQLMDEAALRDLVGEIVRAELQGALGERITRNVRKLVRREIHRALTAHEME
ncbi:hypothetical protein OS189_09190 [Sulfitobacter sp. F26169L]|uniref:hypothetical protein n=1 Tax=Sulfitobacter sp. F26169L TaxID=2996015 RepID=UPI002260BB1E|nr:hypothetical protein [Sulfitobacter sp. F26169L]MCX7566513.1 hypothetical protein [Sulfitobacter sp. F26169L]